ncbi:MAG: hypothetical protein ACXVHS_08560 [Methanobacterium sp.]
MPKIPNGVEQKTTCKEECHVLLIEPVETLNTGDGATHMTDSNLEWI